MRNSVNNPFISCTARDMSYADVMRFWCSPYECYRIREKDLASSRTPIIIEGARGSGKTMILKHLSYFCQKEAFDEGKILDSISSLGYLGVYFRYSADFSSLFDSLNCSKAYREYMFERHFQLSVCMELVKILQDFDIEIDQAEKTSLYASVSELCKCQITNVQSLVAWIKREIQKHDETIRKSQYLNIEESFDPWNNTLSFDLISILQTEISRLKNTLIIIIIDEYENVGMYQRLINTYLKQMEGEKRYTFRIGVRPEGIGDYSTKVSGEFLQDGRDFLKKSLIISSDDRTANYSNFVKNVINRRLRMVPMFSQADITIDNLLGKKENYDKEAQWHVKGKKDHFSEVLMGKGDSEKNEIRDIIGDNNPIVEAYYLMRYKRGESIARIKQIKEEVAAGLDTPDTKKYRLDMRDKYKAALLFWLIDKYKAKKMYYGFSTYLYLSSGSIYDFIGLCRMVFDELESDYFTRFTQDPQIPLQIQTRAAQKYAESQLEKVRINHDYGPQMYRFVQNMCSLFVYYHKGDLGIKYPETNQFYIEGNFDSAGVNKEIWRSLLRWGIVIKKPTLQRASLSVNSKAQLYYVNKSYYPIFGISCRIRGGYNFALTNGLWDEMITSLVDPAIVVKNTNKKLRKDRIPKEKTVIEDTDTKQLTLFDVGDLI